jgi:hypothetical protein
VRHGAAQTALAVCVSLRCPDPLQLKANWQTSHDVCIRLMWLDATSAQGELADIS